MTDKTPAFSVIMPARNETANIERCIAAIRQAGMSHENVEIVVVDNHSTDATANIARKSGAKVVIPDSRINISALRNLGARKSQGRALLFLDADMEPPKEWLAAIDHHLHANGADVVGFVEKVPASAPWFARVWSDRLRARRNRVMEVDFLPGRNICVKRSWFERVGGFDEDLKTSEDKDFAMRLHRAGAKVLQAPSPNPVHWGYEKTLGEFVRKEFWRQGSHVSMIRRHGASARLLRFPVLCVGHALWPLVALAMGAAASSWSQAAAVLALWPLPALAAALWRPLSRANPLKLAQFTFLHWLRMTVAGWSVLFEALAVLRSSARRRYG